MDQTACHGPWHGLPPLMRRFGLLRSSNVVSVPIVSKRHEDSRKVYPSAFGGHYRRCSCDSCRRARPIVHAPDFIFCWFFCLMRFLITDTRDIHCFLSRLVPRNSSSDAAANRRHVAAIKCGATTCSSSALSCCTSSDAPCCLLPVGDGICCPDGCYRTGARCCPAGYDFACSTDYPTCCGSVCCAVGAFCNANKVCQRSTSSPPPPLPGGDSSSSSSLSPGAIGGIVAGSFSLVMIFIFVMIKGKCSKSDVKAASHAVNTIVEATQPNYDS